MRVLHVVQGYTPAIGGTEWLVQNVSENLVTQFQDEVTVYTTNAYNCGAFYEPWRRLMPADETTINGVRVRRFPVINVLGPPLKVIQYVAYRAQLPYNDWIRTVYGGPIVSGMTRAIGEFDGDVVMAGSFPLLHMFYAATAKARNRLPLVFDGGMHPEDRWSFGRSMIYQAIERADAYIAGTTYERDYLISRGVDARKLHVIGRGVDADRFETADGRSIREAHGLGDCPVVAYIGQQAKHKGIDTLLQAMERIWEGMPEVRLLIAGARTNYSPTLSRIIGQMDDEHQRRIVLIENFSEDQKPQLFAACDVFAYPSVYESFGIAFVEAWAAAKPVVGCWAGAIPSVVRNEEDGLLAEPRDSRGLAEAILRLLKDAGLRRCMGQSGQEKVRKFHTWAVVAARFRQVYQAVLHE
jgi:glycosyltransferase involved in cell wall biosynthesis